MEAESDWSALRQDRLADQITELLYKRLMFGALRPGQRINEAEMARELGVSRNPVREAVRRLEQRGLLRSEPRRGTFVRELTLKDINDIYAFRVQIESFCIAEAAKNVTDEDLQELDHLVDCMAAAAARNEGVQLVEHDLCFHRRVAEISGNSRALRSFDDISSEVRMFIVLVEQHFERLHDVATDHVPILDALKTRQPRRAKAAIVAHINDAWHKVVKDYQEYVAETGTGVG